MELYSNYYRSLYKKLYTFRKDILCYLNKIESSDCKSEYIYTKEIKHLASIVISKLSFLQIMLNDESIYVITKKSNDNFKFNSINSNIINVIDSTLNDNENLDLIKLNKIDRILDNELLKHDKYQFKI